MWNDYVKHHLIPRLHIYLTDTLENPKQTIQQIPFVQWLSNEANEAARIKNDVPVMVILENPPYSGISQNKGKWITDLIEDYKYVEGVHFNERKHWLQDDYVKFIRFGQYFVEKNGEGILAFINNHGFLDNPTFRGIRWHLLKTFDKIYILDLHGNAKKKETAPDGSKDENVFDIQQGVSINIFVKTGNKTKEKLAEVYHYDLYGRRNEKYSFLLNNTLQTILWKKLQLIEPQYFFVEKDFSLKEEYDKGFAINEIFNVNVTGIVTMGNEFIINEDKNVLKNRIEKLKNKDYDEQELNKKFSLGKNYSKWVLQNIPRINLDETKFVKMDYRPFDIRWTYFDNNLIWRWRENVMQHFLNGENMGLVIGRQGQVVGSMLWNLVFVTKQIVDFNLYYRGGGMVFPLYLYPDTEKLFEHEKRKPNLNAKILKEISQRLGLQFTEEKEETENTFVPIDVLDYIYAVLHSPTYRERYKEFLKIDFPRVPYPENAKQFWNLVELGGKLRRLHLLEGVEPQAGIANFPITDSNEVEKPQYVGNKVYINDTQYFDNVPLVAWNFYIGGYQPAQKWLKDRKGRVLNYDDIVHYQRVIRVLTETEKVMGEVDK